MTMEGFVASTAALQAGLDGCRKQEHGIEFWFARDLQQQFGYGSWESFERVVLKAAQNARMVGVSEDDHFRQVTKMVPIGSGAEREVADIMLTRYGAYLVAVNADSTKPNVAFLKHYFVVEARKQEVIARRVLDAERVESRQQLRAAEKALSGLFQERGLDGKQMGTVRAKGDKALFGGNTTQEMKDRYGITRSRSLADFLPTLTIAAKTLVNEMTKVNLEANSARGERAITDEHVQNSTSVRSMLGDRGIRPEDLPADEDVTKIERRLASEEKRIASTGFSEPC